MVLLAGFYLQPPFKGSNVAEPWETHLSYKVTTLFGCHIHPPLSGSLSGADRGGGGGEMGGPSFVYFYV